MLCEGGRRIVDCEGGRRTVDCESGRAVVEDDVVEAFRVWPLVCGMALVLLDIVEAEPFLVCRGALALLGFRWSEPEVPLAAGSVGVFAPLRIAALLLSPLRGGLVVTDRGGGRIEAPKLPVAFCVVLLVLV